MELENKKQLEKMEKFFNTYKSIPSEELYNICISDFDDLIDPLTSSKNIDILIRLMNFFERGFDYDIEGVCEHLKNEICRNYTPDQILEALYKKFDYLINNDVEICVEISHWFFDWNKFDDFRKMFNTVKSAKSQEFLSEFVDWYKDIYAQKIAILREDMKKW